MNVLFGWLCLLLGHRPVATIRSAVKGVYASRVLCGRCGRWIALLSLLCLAACGPKKPPQAHVPPPPAAPKPKPCPTVLHDCVCEHPYNKIYTQTGQLTLECKTCRPK